MQSDMALVRRKRDSEEAEQVCKDTFPCARTQVHTSAIDTSADAQSKT